MGWNPLLYLDGCPFVMTELFCLGKQGGDFGGKRVPLRLGFLGSEVMEGEEDGQLTS
jgi:hypothetical protein